MRTEIKFSINKFRRPDAVYWPGYFWMWTGPLDVDVLLEQLRDMKEHDALSVCTLPMPKKFRPDSTNNQMDPDYLTPEFFERVKVVVEEAGRLGMNYWLYDEGGWPSGEACGQVTKGHPELQASAMSLGEDGNWHEQKVGTADRLNPKATERFINLTHDGYKAAVGRYFGETISFAFTDEPSAGRVRPDSIPWTKGFGADFESRFDYRAEQKLGAFGKPPDELTHEDMRVRVDFFDLWSQRFVDAYLMPIRDWCREKGLLSGGHLGGEDETTGGVKHGYGHVLRALRAFDLPGIDIIWRQIFPGKPNHHFPLYAATAAHQIGSPWAFTESFGVYGNGLTLEQMKWLTDYQYVRGINLMVLGCYPLTTREHHMCGERPHFGPVNPLWDYVSDYHRYTARLGYALSCGRPVCETALYFPVRDTWARGVRNKDVEQYEELAEALLRQPCGYDLVDDDVLTDPQTVIGEGACLVGPMTYTRMIIPPCSWLKEETAAALAEFVRCGGHLYCLGRLPGVDGDEGDHTRASLGEETLKHVRVIDSVEFLISEIPALVAFEPPTSTIRVISRELESGSIYFLWNEGSDEFKGCARFPKNGPLSELVPQTGEAFSLQDEGGANDASVLPLHLDPGGSRLLIFGDLPSENRPVWKETSSVNLVDGWEARAVREFRIGSHNYEIRKVRSEWEPVDLGPWRERFTEDFSGDVAYRISIHVKKAWLGRALKLSLGQVEYAARVRVNRTEVGSLIWRPWEIVIAERLEGESLELEITVTNTLANQLSSEQVRNDWANREGRGWPGPYDRKAAEFERDSRGGGLHGPVTLKVGVLENLE